MLRKYLASIALAFACILGIGQSARAQFDIPLTPFQGFGDMVQQNLNFEAQFYPWAWQQSQIVAIQTRGQQIPFDAMTIHRANVRGSEAFGGYIQGLQQSSQRTSDALDNYGRQAIRGYSPYVNPQGQGYWLPYGPEAYYQYQGYIYRGPNYYDPSGNLYPR